MKKKPQNPSPEAVIYDGHFGSVAAAFKRIGKVVGQKVDVRPDNGIKIGRL